MKKNNKELYSLFANNRNTVAWVHKRERDIKIKLIVLVLYFALLLLVPTLILLFMPSNSDASQWFQRCGTIVLVLSILAQIKTQSLEELVISRSHPFLGCNRYINNKYQTCLSVSIFITYSAIVLGTVITGYGDILYAWLIKC